MARRRARVAVLGGTFDRFHAGHEALLRVGLAAGDRLGVGVTTERYLRRHPKPWGGRIEPFARRRRNVLQFLRSVASASRFSVTPLDDSWGRSVEDGIDVLVVSADTRAGGFAVNAERRRRGRKTLPVRVVPLLLADDLLPLSSRRIRAGRISRTGRRRSPFEVGVASDRATDRAGVERELRRAVPRVPLRVVLVPSQIGSTMRPGGAALRRLAVTRARSAAQRAELGVGVARRSPGGGSVEVSIWDGQETWKPRARGPPRPSTLETAVRARLDARAGRRVRLRP